MQLLNDVFLVHQEQFSMEVVLAVVIQFQVLASTRGISHISNVYNVNSTFIFA